MKRNVVCGILLLGALALGSCSTTKLASNQVDKDDDVYFSNAKAGDAPEYVAKPQARDVYSSYDYADDYYYYGSYASRINRFGYVSPFGYYNDLYYGYSPYNAYSPYYGGYSPYYSGIGFGVGFGYGYGYPGYYGYSPYNYWGTGYGGYPFWGIYSAYGYGGYGYGGFGYGGGYGYGYGGRAVAGNPRPYRGSGAPTNAMVNRSTRPIGYNGAYPVNSAYPGRPANSSYNGGGRNSINNTNGARPTYTNSNSRPGRDDGARPVYQPQSIERSSPPPSSSGSSSGGSSSGGGGGGGGNSRPGRP